jgi:Flp pilus assembly protein TadD
MNKIKAAVLFFTIVVGVNFVKAQTIEDGKKFMYYEKYISAKEVFQKLLAANPNNTDAAYWLGQTMILNHDNRDVPGAKALYLKTLEANSNNALLLAGIGHIELIEGKTQEARNHFETAISLSQGKSIAVLNAIGAANGDYDVKNGDAAYAIEKLKLATTIKGFKDPETYCLLGDAYRKVTDGGSAQRAYESALTIASNYARAKYRIGKIYQTQGTEQKDIYMQYYNDAIAMDPNYAPVYYNLYELLRRTNINKAGEYLEKFLSLMGADEPQACYYRATIKFAQGLFAESITQAEGCISSAGATADPRLYGLIAYAKDKMNDSTGAKASFEKYFKFEKPENIGPTDDTTYARLQMQFGNDSVASIYYNKAIEADTSETDKISLIKSIGARFESQKKFASAALWYSKILSIKKNLTKGDIYDAAYNYYKGGNYQASADAWGAYTAKFPEETYGYYMTGMAQNKIDTSFVLALAVPSYQKVIDLGEAQWATDSVKVKTHLLNAYKFFIQYSWNGKKDAKTAADYCAKYLAKDPNDAEVQGYQKAFVSMMNKPATPQRTTPATKPAAGTTKPATGTTKPTTGGGTKADPAKKK